mmetsp:Transcript_38907/g.91004  ORF Transcript_38907/g.91004 Transcript_38907/m.91004 type:complete len:93 (-) Transcript_38907:43-321(-)
MGVGSRRYCIDRSCTSEGIGSTWEGTAANRCLPRLVELLIELDDLAKDGLLSVLRTFAFYSDPIQAAILIDCLGGACMNRGSAIGQSSCKSG